MCLYHKIRYCYTIRSASLILQLAFRGLEGRDTIRGHGMRANRRTSRSSHPEFRCPIFSSRQGWGCAMMAMRSTYSAFLLALSLLSSAQAADPELGGLLRRLSWFRLDVAGGRISDLGLSRAPSRTFTAEGVDAKEWLTINPASDEPSLNYRYEGGDRRWTIEFRGSNWLLLQDKSHGETVTFAQIPAEAVRLSIERSGSPKREFTARSLWHLLVFQPEAKAALLPRLEALNPGWGLERQATEIKQQLFAATGSSWDEDRTAWQRCVGQLASADYQARQNADRQLRAGGVITAAYLQTLDRARMEPEQARRVSQILDIAAQQSDDPASVAAGWAYDARVWCELLRDDDAEHRQVAADHLGLLLGRPLKFDPTADTTTRAAQVRMIEETLLRR
jgi:hypothetical protein